MTLLQSGESQLQSSQMLLKDAKQQAADLLAEQQALRKTVEERQHALALVGLRTKPQMSKSCCYGKGRSALFWSMQLAFSALPLLQHSALVS